MEYLMPTQTQMWTQAAFPDVVVRKYKKMTIQFVK